MLKILQTLFLRKQKVEPLCFLHTNYDSYEKISPIYKNSEINLYLKGKYKYDASRKNFIFNTNSYLSVNKKNKEKFKILIINDNNLSLGNFVLKNGVILLTNNDVDMFQLRFFGFCTTEKPETPNYELPKPDDLIAKLIVL